MLRFLLLSIALAVPTLLLISFLVFFAGYLSPADPVDILVGERAAPEAKARVRREWGLDRPPLERYANYVWGIVSRGDLGRSYRTREPVAETLRRGLPHTATLASAALLLSLLVGVPLGVWAAVRAGGAGDRLAMGAALTGVAIPSFVLAPVLVLIFALHLRWLPVAGWQVFEGRWEYLVLPAVVLAARSTALVARLARAAMLEALAQDYVRTARAKGLSENAILFKHALKNAAPPILTAAGTTFGYLLTGSFVVETFFTIPGLGFQSIDSIMKRDYTVIQGVTLLAAATFVLVNLLVDVGYGLLDPRARAGRKP